MENNIKKFWDAQGQKNTSPESISNLEADQLLCQKKVELESAKILPILENVSTNQSLVLDLGGGTGQWAFNFAHFVKEVTLVEFSEEMLKHAKRIKEKNNILNVNLIHCHAEEFLVNKVFDIIWISGLLIYLSDKNFENLIENCKKMSRSGSYIVLRDGTGIDKRHEIIDQYSEALKLNYSASYRTSDEYINAFEKHEFKCLDHQDMFENESGLNKWAETRLRLYTFVKT